MNFKAFSVTFLFLIVGCLSLSAQPTGGEFTEKGAPDGSLKEINSDNWSFFVDNESKIYYIDFESINVNLNDIVVKDQSGNIVYKEELWNLPVNTIYELDYTTFKPGTYDIELRAYTGVIRKTITVK